MNSLHNQRVNERFAFQSSSESSITMTKKPVWPLNMRSPQLSAWPSIVPWLMKMFLMEAGA